MIQQGLIFALGFMVASLLSLLLLPVLSRRAVRLATRRLSMLVPWSAAEVLAERDQIRAQHAAAARRLEQSIEQLTEQKAAVMGEAGRQLTRLVETETGLAEARRRIETLEADLHTATADARDAQGTLGLQMQLLHDTLGLAEDRLALLRATQARLAEFESLCDEQRASIAGLELRSTGLDLKIRAALAQTASAANELKDVRGVLDQRTGERDLARTDAASLGLQRDGLQAELSGVREALEAARRAQAEHGGVMEALSAQIAQRDERIAALQAREPAAMPDLPEGDDAEREAARLRHAVASLAAELVRFGEAHPSRQPAPALEAGAEPH